VKEFAKFQFPSTVMSCRLSPERLSANVKLTLHKTPIRSAMTACPAWEFQADTCVLKLQLLQNNVLTTGKVPRRTPVRDLHVAFEIPYVRDFIIKL
jgi:hypothetical protein